MFMIDTEGDKAAKVCHLGQSLLSLSLRCKTTKLNLEHKVKSVNAFPDSFISTCLLTHPYFPFASFEAGLNG